MKPKILSENTFFGHLNRLKYAHTLVDEERLNAMLLQLKQLATPGLSFLPAPVYFAIDYTSRKYIFFSGTLGDYSAEEMMEGGLDKSLQLMPPDFLHTHNEKIFPALLAFLKDKQAETRLFLIPTACWAKAIIL